jgi:prefoldin subunit 5
LLPLTIACLVLGILLFDRREMLKGRTQKLEDTLIKLAPVIELETASFEEGERPTHTPRDISPCTSEIIDAPDTSDFWATYKDHLELVDQPVMDFKSKENELTLFYKLDPVTGKRAKDINGYNITTGDGTMQPLLDDIIDRAAAQLDRMNETREQLLVIRQELETTIDELNNTKTRLREALNKIVQLEAEISRLNGEIDSLNAEISRLKGTIAELEDTIREKDREIAVLTEKLADRDLEIKNLKEHIRKLEIEIRRITQPGSGGLDTAIVLKQGAKGKVVAVNNKWKFVIIELSDEFVDELTRESRIGLDLTQLKLPFDLQRPADKGSEYVTRVRLREANIDEKIGVADILVNWQQLPIMVGDEAYR